MKTIKTLLALFLAFFFLQSNAQVDDREWILSAVPHIGIPISRVKETHGISLGGHIQYENKIADQSRFLVQLGTAVMQGKEYDTGLGYKETHPAVGANHLRVGLKYFPAGNGFFVSGLVGGGYVSSRAVNSFGFSYAPVLGVEFGRGRYFNASIRYDATNTKDFHIATATFSLGYHL